MDQQPANTEPRCRGKHHLGGLADRVYPFEGIGLVEINHEVVLVAHSDHAVRKPFDCPWENNLQTSTSRLCARFSTDLLINFQKLFHSYHAEESCLFFESGWSEHFKLFYAPVEWTSHVTDC